MSQEFVDDLDRVVQRALASWKVDPWRRGAALFLGKPDEDVTKDERVAFKVAFFRILSGR